MVTPGPARRTQAATRSGDWLSARMWVTPAASASSSCASVSTSTTRRRAQDVPQRPAGVSEQSPVVVLPEHGVGERGAILDAAPHAYRVALERPQAGRGLAGVRDARARARDGVHRAASHGRDPGQVLQEVQGDALAGEHGLPRGGGDGEHVTAPSPGPLCRARIQARPRLQLPQHGGDDGEAGDDELAAGDEAARRRGSRGGAQQARGGVAAGGVFGEGAADLLETERLSQSRASDRWRGGRGRRSRARPSPRASGRAASPAGSRA